MTDAEKAIINTVLGALFDSMGDSLAATVVKVLYKRVGAEVLNGHVASVHAAEMATARAAADIAEDVKFGSP